MNGQGRRHCRAIVLSEYLNKTRTRRGKIRQWGLSLKDITKGILRVLSFIWRGKRFEVEEVLLVWRDYSRRMRMAHNMTERHRLTAESRGSWGVGRFFFRVQTKTWRVFDLYYDRAPDSASDREGHWFLWREMSPTEKEQDP